MLFTYLMFSSAHAFDWDAYQERSISKRFEAGICAGISAECMFPGIKVGGVYNSIGVGISIAPDYQASTLSLRFYPDVPFPIRPYAYAGVMTFFSYGGDGIAPGVGVGADIHLGPIVLQPSVGITNVTTGGALSILVKI